MPETNLPPSESPNSSPRRARGLYLPISQIDLFGADEVASAPVLESYEWIVVSSSAGKDSQTALRQTVFACDDAGVPRDRIVVVHADLGRIEWPGTKELAEEQAKYYGLRFEVVRRPGCDLLERVREKYQARQGVPPWPGLGQARWCTSDFKRGPIRTLFTRLVDEIRPSIGRRKARLLNVMGMRAEESPKRADMLPFERDAGASNKTVRDVDIWLPIHHWTVEEVWRDIRTSGVSYHYAYDRGMPRLSCRFCIYAPETALILAGQHNPELLNEYVAVEQETGYSFTQKTSLIQIQAAIRNGATVMAVPDWSM